MSAADDASAAGASVRPFNFAHAGRQVTVQIDDSRDALLTEFGKATMRDRYLLPGESYQDMFARVACANSDEIVRGEGNGHAQRMYDAISQLWFMPATPVLSNSGVSRGLPISCFLNLVGDSMESIAAACYENIWLAAKGGGIGSCYSPVREINHPIAGSLTGRTSGVIPFIHWMDAQTLAISQGSLRRGSAAGYLDISHPEIEEFIDIRRPTGGDERRKAKNMHHGVTVSDAFMEKVFAAEGEDRSWNLISPKSGETIKTVDARELWIKLVTARLETGEPYIIFSDAVERGQPWHHKQLGLKVQQSNLCSEITLPTGEDHLGNWRTAVCCLSSLNFETLDQWEGNDAFIYDVLSFLDNVLENFIREAKTLTGFERAVYSAERERSVGLGMMGFHSYLQSKELPYEGEHARSINKRVWSWLKKSADAANANLAAERGACPDAAELDYPVRLSHVFSIAPTASISIIAGGASACGEPWVANSFTQKTLGGSFNVRNRYLDAQLRRRYHQLRESLEAANKTVRFMLKNEPMFAGVLEQDEEQWVEDQWQSITINSGSVQHLPYLCDMEKATFRTAYEMDQRWVIIHAADRTPYICQAQSVNIFLPSTVHKKDLNTIHKFAWEQGLKSVYYLRSRTASKAMAVSHVAGEMPKAQLDTSGPIYDEDPTCQSCQ